MGKYSGGKEVGLHLGSKMKKEITLNEFSARISLLYCALAFPTTPNINVHPFSKAGGKGEVGPDLCIKNS